MTTEASRRRMGFSSLDPFGDVDAEELARLDVDRPGAQESRRRVLEAERDAIESLPPPLRFNDRHRVYPQTIILPDPKLFPGLTPRIYHFTASGGGATNLLQGNVAFADWASIYQISAAARVVDGGGNVWFASQAMAQIFVNFQRSQGDQLTFGGQVPQGLLAAFAGTGDSPMPIGSPGWAFEANQQLVINGAVATRDWDVTIAFHVIESIPGTNLGMSRTPYYTRDDRR